MKKKVLAGMAGLTSIFGYGIYKYVKLLSLKEKSEKRLNAYYEMLNQWLCNKAKGKSIITYFNENQYKRIAIYGVGELALRFMEELKDSEIDIVYCVDSKAEDIGFYGLTCITPDEIPDQGNVDVMVITPVHYFNEIEEKLRDVFEKDIVSLQDVIFFV